MKKLLGLTFVALFMMSMASKSLIVKKDDPFLDCEAIAEVVYMQSNDPIEAELAYYECTDDIIDEIDFELEP